MEFAVAQIGCKPLLIKLLLRQRDWHPECLNTGAKQWIYNNAKANTKKYYR